MSAKFKSLFLCTGNSCGSQMAEEWAQHLKCKVIESSCLVFPEKKPKSLTSTLITHSVLPNPQKVKRRPYLIFAARETKPVSLQKHYH